MLFSFGGANVVCFVLFLHGMDMMEEGSRPKRSVGNGCKYALSMASIAPTSCTYNEVERGRDFQAAMIRDVLDASNNTSGKDQVDW